MYATITDSLDNVSAGQWNRLIGDGNPFVRHEFLVAMEHHGCVGQESGWTPQHVLVYDDDEELIGAAPMYLKFHSYGEYVFDWAWARCPTRINIFPRSTTSTTSGSPIARGDAGSCPQWTQGQFFVRPASSVS